MPGGIRHAHFGESLQLDFSGAFVLMGQRFTNLSSHRLKVLKGGAPVGRYAAALELGLGDGGFACAGVWHLVDAQGLIGGGGLAGAYLLKIGRAHV